MKNKSKYKRVACLLFFIFSYYSELCFPEQDVSTQEVMLLRKTTLQHEEALSYSMQEWLCYFISVLNDYYTGPRVLYREISILSALSAVFYIGVLNRNPIISGFYICKLPTYGSLVGSLIYDIVDQMYNPVASNIPEINLVNKAEKTYFELEVVSLPEQSVLYTILNPLRELGVTKIKLTTARIDNEQHLLGMVIKSKADRQIAFDITLSMSNADYYFIEFHCVDDTDFNDPSRIPLSVFSEELINALAMMLRDDNDFCEGSVNLNQRIKGIDYSVGKDIAVTKIKQIAPISIYSICSKRPNGMKLQQSYQDFSNHTLSLELTKRMSIEPEGWVMFSLKLVFKQFEHLATIELSLMFFKWLFLSNSPTI